MKAREEFWSIFGKIRMSAEYPLIICGHQEGQALPHVPLAFRLYDILFVSDYSLSGGTTSSNVAMLKAAAALGLHCACLHWPRLERASKQINAKIWRILHQEIADGAYGKTLECKLVVVNQPSILNQLPRQRPEVRTEACVIVVNQPPVTGGRTIYEIENVLKNAHSAFGVAPTLAPISPLIRRIIRAATDYQNFTPVDWTPLIDSRSFRYNNSSWDKSRLPIIGRHARDHVDKWPSDRIALCQAYCAEAPVEVRILGGAEKAKLVLGKIPSNWSVLPFDSVDVQNFLSGIDFLIHYPHENWIETFGRSAMEAMAVGVAVILPRNFSEIFGDAAVYTDPPGVFDTIQALWADKEAYEAQIQCGLKFVERVSSPERFAERVMPYLAKCDRGTRDYGA